MEKTTIEIFRIEKHWQGYGLLTPPYTSDSQSTLDCLTEWSSLNPGKKVYRHLLRTAQENIGKDGFGAQKGDKSTWGGWTYDFDIPYCDLVYYLDIYWQ